MKILVLNSGSSSIKYQLIDMDTCEPVSTGLVERIGQEEGVITHKYLKNGDEQKIKQTFPIPNHTVGLKRVAELLTDPKVGVISNPKEINAVGHRMVHGGETLTKTCIITPEVESKIQELFPLAPLHNPPTYQGYVVAKEIFPQAEQVAVFDTAFHQTMPEKAFRYAIPEELYKKHGVRKYGFHGTSHKYVSEQALVYLGKPDAKIITIHLGNGSSMAAIKDGKCVDTTMGLGPLSGLMMGTRSGDIDASIIFYMINQLGYTAEQVGDILNKQSGVLGLFGSSDMRDLEDAVAAGDALARKVTDMYAYRIKQYIGSYTAVLNGLDAIIFTAGVGENDFGVRSAVCADMEYFGIKIDEELNKKRVKGIRELQTPDSRTKVLIIPTNEELEIATQAYELIK